MMDLSLDNKQNKALDCSTCDPQKMKLRNCNGAYGEKSQSPMLVNGNVYRSCPRAMVAGNWEVGYLISLYFECRENKVSPFGTSLATTTAFVKQTFDQMDTMVYDFRERERIKHEEKMKRDMAKNKSKGTRGKR